MGKKRNIIVVTIFSLCFPFLLNATHIVGGEIYYDCLGNNDYKVTLKIYRDCNSIADFDYPAYIAIYNVAGVLLDSIVIDNPQITQLDPLINNPCFQAPVDICIEEGIYTTTINLPPIPGGYILAYQRCCRGDFILNLINSGDVGSTYMVKIPDSDFLNSVCNSSPRFSNYPPIVLCVNSQFVFDHSAIDLDGDSLVYSFCDPYNGATFFAPWPKPAGPPPYSTIPFLPPYTGANPISSSPAMIIDSQTGLISGTPNIVGCWAVGVCVQEYRSGFLIGESKRDFQFNVMNCPVNTVSAIPLQQTFCFGFTVEFLNNSINSDRYHWDFGDPSITKDTSNLITPSWTYPGSGTYTVTLIANPGLFCSDTSFTVFKIDPLLDPKFVSPSAECLIGNSFDFNAGGEFVGPGTSIFLWNFGMNANPANSLVQNPAGVVFNSAGTFPVTLTIIENGCTKSYNNFVKIYPMPNADFNSAATVTCTEVNLQFNDLSASTSLLTYQWNFGDGGVSSDKNPKYAYPLLGVYDVSLVVTSLYGCTDTEVKPQLITVNPSPQALFSANPTAVSIFDPHITIVDQSSGAVGCKYFFGDDSVSDSCNMIKTFSDTGTYVITQVVTNIFGCTDTFKLPIRILPEYRFFIPNSFTPDNYDALNDVFMPVIMGAKSYEFSVYDRWSNKVFETTDTKTGWDGTFNGGRRCEEGVYVYRIKYHDVIYGKDYSRLGIVTLIK